MFILRIIKWSNCQLIFWRQSGFVWYPDVFVTLRNVKYQKFTGKDIYVEKWGSYYKAVTKLVYIISQARKETLPKASVTQRPEVVDDFVRNFLVKMKMYRTLDCFQTEWLAFQQFCISSRPMLYRRNRNIFSLKKKTTVGPSSPSNSQVHLCFQVRIGSEGRTQGRGCRHRTWYLCQEPAIGPRIKIHQIRNGKIQRGRTVSIEILSIPHYICNWFSTTFGKLQVP